MAEAENRDAQGIRTVKSLPLGEELFSSISHGIGALLGIAGLVVGLFYAGASGRGVSVVSVAIYGSSLIMLYLMSCLYHALAFTPAKKVFKILDHAAIYLLIAGTYTVFSLSALSGPLGWTIFGLIWGFAALGISLESFWVTRPKWVSAVIYVAMGWIVVFAIGPVRASLPPVSFSLLVAGGITYTLGAVVYALKSIPWTHPVWHLFVLGGSILHFFSVLTAL